MEAAIYVIPDNIHANTPAIAVHVGEDVRHFREVHLDGPCVIIQPGVIGPGGADVWIEIDTAYIREWPKEAPMYPD